jgi:hypothetical protein
VNRDPQKTGRCFALKGWHIALALLIVLGTLIGLYLVVYKNRVEERIGALRAAGYPTTVAELAEYTKLPEGAENAAEVYLKALAAFVPSADEANVPVLGKARWPDQGIPLPAPGAKAIAACLAANQKCLALLHEAAGIGHCRYDYHFDALMGVSSEAFDLGSCAKLLRLAAIWDAYEGQTDAAVTCIKDELRLGDSLERLPALLSHLVRVNFTAAALDELERTLRLASLADPQLRQLDEALARTARTLDFTKALITERCRLTEERRNLSTLVGPVWGNVPGFRDLSLADTLEYMEARIEASQLPPLDRLRRFREIDDEIDQLSFLHVIVRFGDASMTHIAELDVRIRTHLDLARTALAIERYRLATAEVPERLAELVPTYLEHVPVDHFDGQSIRYRRTDPGYLLYSVDTDGQDNGGRERNDKNRDGPYDLCFIVTR